MLLTLKSKRKFVQYCCWNKSVPKRLRKNMNLVSEGILTSRSYTGQVMKQIWSRLVVVCADLISDWPWSYHVIAGHADELRALPLTTRLWILKSFKDALVCKKSTVNKKNISPSFPPPSALPFSSLLFHLSPKSVQINFVLHPHFLHTNCEVSGEVKSSLNSYSFYICDSYSVWKANGMIQNPGIRMLISENGSGSDKV